MISLSNIHHVKSLALKMVEAYPATALQSRHRPWLKLEKIAKPYVQGIGEFGSPCGSVALGPLIFWELVVSVEFHTL
jgi:hypothetical protein